MIRRHVSTVSTSRADDAAHQALADAAELVAEVPSARIVGGHMANLLLAAFPDEHGIVRRTADADAAVPTEVAGGDSIHRALIDQGYTIDGAGNHYVKGDLAIDLLVPSSTERYRSVVLGGRGFDAVPGIRIALQSEPIVLDVDVTLLDGTELGFSIRVPSVELATVLKAYAYGSRRSTKDLTDIHNLLGIAQAYPAEDIGGWHLRDGPLQGSRLDAARILHGAADTARQSRSFREAGVLPDRFTALVRTLVAL